MDYKIKIELTKDEELYLTTTDWSDEDSSSRLSNFNGLVDGLVEKGLVYVIESNDDCIYVVYLTEVGKQVVDY